MPPPGQHNFRHCRGLTLLEVSLVISMMMMLISLVFVGARAWRIGSDRAKCILNQRTFQMAVRSYQNMYGFPNGAQPNGGNLPESLWTMEFISEHLYNCATGISKCPGGGNYLIADPSRFPDDGVVYMTCSLAESRGHGPENDEDW